MPAGICRTTTCATAVTCALATATSTPGWKNTLTMPMPAYDVASMCSMSLTVVVRPRWNKVEMRADIWSGGSPVYCQATAITGMRISGKMSVGVRNAASGPISISSSAITMNV
jgi:hypothetical protein